jgi:hypothetical protein
MIDYLERACIKLHDEKSADDFPRIPVSELGEDSCYVLLAEPGMGKTSIFEALADKNKKKCVTVQDFILRDDWPNEFYYLDALDQARGLHSASALQALREKLYKLGIKKFALVCRSAEWHFKTDLEDIKKNAEGGILNVYALSPLSEPHAIALLEEQEVAQPKKFLDDLHDLGLGYAEGNPQQLIILAKAAKTAGGNLPKNRNEAFELACAELLKEQNERHTASQDAISNDRLLQMAGWLSAVLLLSGSSAIKKIELQNLKHANPVDLNDFTYAQFPRETTLTELTKVLARPLFKVTANGFEVIHRTVAEFLAARYIAGRVTAGLSVSRVASLIQFSKTQIYRDLQGLAAWFCNLSQPLQEMVLDTDSRVVFDFADLNILSVNARQELLKKLASDEGFQYTVNYAFGPTRAFPLVETAMLPFVENWLFNYVNYSNDDLSAGESSTGGKTTVALILLDGIRQSGNVKVSPSLLESLVRADSFRFGVRARALEALLENKDVSLEKLTAILNDAWAKKIRDDDRSLVGTLLLHLFPKTLQREVFSYVDYRLSYFDSPSYTRFWKSELNARTDKDLLLILVTEIEKNADAWQLDARSAGSNSMRLFTSLGKLIARAIIELGAKQKIDRLTLWLDFCLSKQWLYMFWIDDEQVKIDLLEWQQNNQQLMRDVLEYRLHNLETYQRFSDVLRINKDAFNFGSFCLENAQVLRTLKPDVAEFLVRSAFNQLYTFPNSKIFKLENIEQFVAVNPNFATLFETLKTSNLADYEWEQENSRTMLQIEREVIDRRAAQCKDRDFLLANLADVYAGKNLAFLADAAWAELSAMEKRYIADAEHLVIIDWFKNHPQLLEAARKGYKACLLSLSNEDLTQSWEAGKVGQEMRFALPALLAAQFWFKNDRSTFEQLNARILSNLIFLNALNTLDGDWFKWVTETHTELSASSYLACMKKLLKAKPPYQPSDLRLIFCDEGLKKFSRALAVPMLGLLPTKILVSRMEIFYWALIGCIQFGEKTEVIAAISARLIKKSINEDQKVCLLLAGAMVESNQFVEHLQLALDAHTAAKEYLFAFLSIMEDRDSGLSERVLQHLKGLDAAKIFRVIAPFCTSIKPQKVVVSPTSAHYSRDFAEKLLQRIYEDSTEEAGAALIELLNQPELGSWLPQLRSAIRRHQHVRLTYVNRALGAFKIADTLANLAPANMADLQAICILALDELSKKIANSPTNLRNQFWDVDSRSNKPKPPHRHEPNCRDVVAANLEPLLKPQRITIQTEIQHANQNQSDFCLFVDSLMRNQMMLPVEVKGDWHKELYTAATTQLETKYSTDYRSEGYGVYLVLWMGVNRGQTSKKKHANLDTSSPEKLKLVLEQEILSQNPSSKILVYVLDLSIDFIPIK